MLLLNPNNFLHMTIAAATFCLVLSSWLAVVLLWSMRKSARQRTIRERLQDEQVEPVGAERSLRLWHDGREAIVRRPGFRRVTLEQKLRRVMHDAGFDIHVRSLVGWTFVLVAFTFF